MAPVPLYVCDLFGSNPATISISNCPLQEKNTCDTLILYSTIPAMENFHDGIICINWAEKLKTTREYCYYFLLFEAAIFINQWPPFFEREKDLPLVLCQKLMNCIYLFTVYIGIIFKRYLNNFFGTCNVKNCANILDIMLNNWQCMCILFLELGEKVVQCLL